MWKHTHMALSDDLGKLRAEQNPTAAQDPGQVAQQQELRRRLLDFVQTAYARGIDPLPLETNHGHRRWRTSVSGWLLFPDTGLAVGTDAELYRLLPEGGPSGTKVPVREEWICRTYWHGWTSTWVTLDDMLTDAVARGTGHRSPQEQHRFHIGGAFATNKQSS